MVLCIHVSTGSWFDGGCRRGCLGVASHHHDQQQQQQHRDALPTERLQSNRSPRTCSDLIHLYIPICSSFLLCQVSTTSVQSLQSLSEHRRLDVAVLVWNVFAHTHLLTVSVYWAVCRELRHRYAQTCPRMPPKVMVHNANSHVRRLFRGDVVLVMPELQHVLEYTWN